MNSLNVFFKKCKTSELGKHTFLEKVIPRSYPLYLGLCGMWQKEDQCFFSSGDLVEFLVAGLKFTAGSVKCGPSNFYSCSHLGKEKKGFIISKNSFDNYFLK